MERPLPEPDADSAPFWEACGRHELRVQRCGDCGFRRHPPRPRCPDCGSFAVEWEQLSGRGEVYSWVVAHPPVLPAFQERVPFAVVLVALAEDPRLRLLGNLQGCEPGNVRIGLPVEVSFEELGDGVTLPQWRPREGVG